MLCSRFSEASKEDAKGAAALTVTVHVGVVGFHCLNFGLGRVCAPADRDRSIGRVADLLAAAESVDVAHEILVNALG